MSGDPFTDEEDGGETEILSFTAMEAGRLDRILAALSPDLSRTRLKSLIVGGAVEVDGSACADPARAVRPGQTIALALPPPEPSAPRPEAIPLAVVHEDEDLLVIDKPAGLVVHPGAGNPSGTLVNALLHHCGDSLSGIGGVLRPGIVHRLDKDTTGLMVAANPTGRTAASRRSSPTAA